MGLRFEFENERKKHLGLTINDTKKVYNSIVEQYKQKLINAPRNVIGYSIDIVLCNMNYYNKLGNIENLEKTWGDNNFYVDLNNSTFVELITDEEGNIDSSDKDVYFKEINELKELDSISFSLKELIDLCKKDDFSINIFSSEEKADFETVFEIEPFRPYELTKSIKTYLNTLK